ncbi:MAG TPA: hypothetical protein VFJ43_15160 [Bacteroidia bacterium]|nr:hypothetical protein [Bacteroidia bacterium]
MGQIRIEKPCHEKWGLMQKREDGRYCLSCEKTVVDFTRMSDAELITYLQNNKQEHACGHFRSDQVVKPGKNPRRFRWLKVSLLFLFGVSFLSSCMRRTQGCYAYYGDSKLDRNKKQETKIDSTHEQHLR